MSQVVERSLPDLLAQIVDNRGRSCPVTDIGFPLIATNCIKDDHKYPLFENVRYVDSETYDHWFRGHPQPNDILFVCKGSPGRVAVVPDPVPFCIAQDMVALRVDSRVADPGYLYYRLKAPDVKGKIKNLHVGTMIPHFKKGDFGKLKFDIHFDIGEQQAIAEVLGALDDKIVANARAEDLMEQLIGALHCEAVQAAGHKTAPLFEIFDVDFGEAFKGEHFSEPEVGRPLIRIRDLKTFTSQIWTTETRARESIVQPGEVVVGMDAEFRPTWWLGEPGLLNQRVCRVRGRSSGAAFSREALREPLMKIEGYKTATTVIHLNKGDLERVRVAVPSADALSRFEAKAEPLLESRVSLATERNALAVMRDVLLPQLMSGKIRVKEAEQIVGDVV